MTNKTEFGAAGLAGTGAQSDAPTGDAGTLHRNLGWFGALMLTLSCLSPVFSIYGLGADVVKEAGTGAAGLFLLGIGAAVVWGMVYAELGSAYPYAGGDYVGVGRILGSAAGFASLAVWAVTAGPLSALEARTIAVYVDDLTGLSAPLTVTLIALAATVVLSLLAVRTSALITGLFLAVEMLAVVVMIVAGFWHPARSLGSVLVTPENVSAAGVLGVASISALALGAVSAGFATVGGNQGIAFGEELREPHRNMGKVIMVACVVGAFATALPVVAMVLGTGDMVAIFRSPAPFSAFMESVAGPVVSRALSAGVALAIFNALIAQIMFCARLFFSIGRDGILHPLANRVLAAVDRKSGSPRGATIVVGIVSGFCCLVDDHTLTVFVSGLVTFTFVLVSLAVLVGRRRKLTGQPGYWRSMLFPLGPVLGLALAAVFAVANLIDEKDGRPSFLLLSAVVIVAVLWYHLVLKRRPGGWAPRAD